MHVRCHACPLCDFNSRTLPEWFSHLRLVHSSEPNFLVTCGIDGCMKTYSKFASLNSHVYRYHKGRVRGCSLPLPTRVTPTSALEVSSIEDLGNRSSSDHRDIADDQVQDVRDLGEDSCNELEPAKQLQRSSALFLLKLKECHGLSQVTINTVIGFESPSLVQ